MGALLIPVLLPGLVAAAVGYLLFIGLGNWGGLEEATLTVPGLPSTTPPASATCCLPSASASGSRSCARPCAYSPGARPEASSGSEWTPLLLGGGLAVGLLAVPADALGADSQDVLFSGQNSIDAVVSEDSASNPRRLGRSQGAGLRDLPRLRISRGPGLSGGLPRSRTGDVHGDRLRRVADIRGRGRHGRGDGSDDQAAVCAASLLGAARRLGKGGRRFRPQCSRPLLHGYVNARSWWRRHRGRARPP